MLSSHAKQLMLSAAVAAIFMMSSLTVDAGNSSYPPSAKTANINLAVASNFYGVPPSNSAITDTITAFEAENPNWTVKVIDNGATATLAANIINGNKAKVDLFLASDTATSLMLYLEHFNLMAPYNSSNNSSYDSSNSWPNNNSSSTPPLFF